MSQCFNIVYLAGGFTHALNDVLHGAERERLGVPVFKRAKDHWYPAPRELCQDFLGVGVNLIARQNRIVDRTIVLNGISDEDPVKCRLKADLPRLLRRTAMMNRAILWALISSIAITVLVIVAFASALLHIQHELGVALLFIVALAAFTVSLVEFAREVRIAMNELDHYG
jgi:Protein of unknown function (DUF2721)